MNLFHKIEYFSNEQPPHDVTEQLKDLLDPITVHYWWKDKNGKYLGCNKNVINLLGLKSQDEIIGKTDYEMIWHKAADTLTYHDQLVMDSEKTHTREEKVTIEDGKVLTFLVSKAPYRDKNGEIIGTIGASLDITMLKQADQVKTEFIKNMEHDIRTPFNGIWGIANILWEQETDSVKKEYLGDITHCAKELLDYCNTILDFSKVESDSFPVIEKKFNLRKLIESVLKIETPAAKNKNLTLTHNLSENLPPVIIGDYYRLCRVIINLLGNAIKFTKKGFVSLTVSMIKQTNKVALIRFIIEDTGEGIPSEAQHYIFEKFSRLSPSNKGLYKGSGLGLKIVKQFIQEMDGEIDLNSSVGNGAKFICTIPFTIPLTDDFCRK